jgi:hypothetical protein
MLEGGEPDRDLAAADQRWTTEELGRLPGPVRRCPPQV